MKTALLFLTLLTPLPVCAERYALLAGVGQPETGGAALTGPRHDVESMRQRLLRFSFAPQNVRTLLDEEATRDAILQNLREVVAGVKAGDTVLFYFTGHGTSNFDEELGSGLDRATGALIPFDAAKKKPVGDSLIVGNRDLRPIFLRLHPDAQGVIVLDACFSEDSAKSAMPPQAMIRYWHPPQQKQHGWRRVGELVRANYLGGKAVETYPYRNILTLAASARFQPAFDIQAAQVSSGTYRTVDGRPHGAMSNALFFGLDGRADHDGDGIVTYGELFQFVQQAVSDEFPQQPQYQVSAQARASLQEPVFGVSTRLAKAGNPAAGRGPVLVELSGANPELTRLIAGIPGARIATSRADYILRAEVSGGYSLAEMPRGSEVATFGGTALSEIRETLTAIAAARELVDYRFSQSKGSVSLETEPPDQGWYYDGQKFQVTGYTSEVGTSILFGVDSTGFVNVLHPAGETERMQPMNKTALFTAKAGAPFGSSTLKLLFFRQPPPGLERFYCVKQAGGTRCPEFSANSEKFRELMRLLNGFEGVGSEAAFRLETRP